MAAQRKPTAKPKAPAPSNPPLDQSPHWLLKHADNPAIPKWLYGAFAAVVGAIVLYYAYTIWVWLLIPAILTLIYAYYLVQMLLGKWKKSHAGFATLGVLLMWATFGVIVWATWPKPTVVKAAPTPPPPPPFALSVTSPAWLRTESSSPLRYFVVSGSSNNRIAHPVFAMLLLQCANVGDTTVRLRDYAIEVRGKSGNWCTMPSIGFPDDGKLYELTPDFDGKEMRTAEGSFESSGRGRFFSKSDPPVRGWVTLSGPREDFASEYRIVVTDEVSGATLPFPIQLGSSEPLDTEIDNPDVYRSEQVSTDLKKVPVEIRYFQPKKRRDMEDRYIAEGLTSPPLFDGEMGFFLGSWLWVNRVDQQGNGDLQWLFGIVMAHVIRGNAYLSGTVTDGRNTGRPYARRFLPGSEITIKRLEPVVALLVGFGIHHFNHGLGAFVMTAAVGLGIAISIEYRGIWNRALDMNDAIVEQTIAAERVRVMQRR